jgi:hypothetical protein
MKPTERFLATPEASRLRGLLLPKRGAHFYGIQAGVATEITHSLRIVGVSRRYPGGFLARKSLILWCREGESNPQGPKPGGF